LVGLQGLLGQNDFGYAEINKNRFFNCLKYF
jgi:hypothetical protein